MGRHGVSVLIDLRGRGHPNLFGRSWYPSTQVPTGTKEVFLRSDDGLVSTLVTVVALRLLRSVALLLSPLVGSVCPNQGRSDYPAGGPLQAVFEHGSPGAPSSRPSSGHRRDADGGASEVHVHGREFTLRPLATQPANGRSDTACAPCAGTRRGPIEAVDRKRQPCEHPLLPSEVTPELSAAVT